MVNDEPKLPIVVKLLIGLVLLLFGLPILSIVLALIVSMRAGPSSGSKELAGWEGRAAPDLAITTTDGVTLHLSQFRGRGVILDCWATWCGPCVREIPHLQRVADDLPQDLVVVGLSNESLQVLHKFAQSKSLRYPIGTSASRLPPFANVSAVPTTFFIDREGTIRKILVGYHEYSQLRAEASVIVQNLD